MHSSDDTIELEKETNIPAKQWKTKDKYGNSIRYLKDKQNVLIIVKPKKIDGGTLTIDKMPKHFSEEDAKNNANLNLIKKMENDFISFIILLSFILIMSQTFNFLNLLWDLLWTL